MFFAFCCTLDDQELIQELKLHGSLPHILPTHVYSPELNWGVIIYIMALGLKEELDVWLSARIELEEDSEKNPSFELLAVSLWLGDPHLQIVAAKKHMSQEKYLASRNNEYDVFGNSLWTFADIGYKSIMQRAYTAGLVPSRCKPRQLYLPSRNLRVLTLFSLAESYNYRTFSEQLKYDLYHENYGYSILHDLAKCGCWNGLLMCILTSNINVDSVADILEQFARKAVNGYFANVSVAWSELLNAPRYTEVEGAKALLKINVTEKLNFSANLLANKDIPAELRFVYLAKQFMEPETIYNYNSTISDNKKFYALCLNALLSNCTPNERESIKHLMVLLPEEFPYKNELFASVKDKASP